MYFIHRMTEYTHMWFSWLKACHLCPTCLSPASYRGIRNVFKKAKTPKRLWYASPLYVLDIVGGKLPPLWPFAAIELWTLFIFIGKHVWEHIVLRTHFLAFLPWCFEHRQCHIYLRITCKQFECKQGFLLCNHTPSTPAVVTESSYKLRRPLIHYILDRKMFYENCFCFLTHYIPLCLNSMLKLLCQFIVLLQKIICVKRLYLICIIIPITCR